MSQTISRAELLERAMDILHEAEARRAEARDREAALSACGECAELREKLAAVEAALRPFAFGKFEHADIADDKILELHLFNEHPMWDQRFYPGIRMRDVRAARAALATVAP